MKRPLIYNHFGSAKIHNSERWRNELSAGHLRTFESIAGPLNRELGYQ